MNKHKTIPLFWAAFSLLLLFTVAPATAKPVDVDTLFNCTWSAATATPVALLDSPVVTVGGNMYLFGGVQGGAIAAASFKFDGTTWTPIAPLPTAVEFPSAVTDGTDCYILGGALTGTGTPQTTLYKYNVALNTYTTLAPFTVGTWNQASVFLGGKIYKWCGTGPATASTNALEIYTIATNTWAGGAAYPITESFVSGWEQGGFIYSAGGIDGATSLATAKAYRYDPAANTWDDAALADLPATRWGAATAFYSPDGLLAGGYVAGVATANISPTVISWDQPSNTWQPVPDMNDIPGASERSRFGGAVLNGSFYGVGGRSIASSAFAGTTSNQKLLCLNVPTNILSSCGSSILLAGPNGELDPGEMVTVRLSVKNVGGPGAVSTTSALTGTLQTGGGVISVQSGNTAGNYGVITSGPGALCVSHDFAFTVDPAVPCGGTVTASLQMQDGATNYGTITYTFAVGGSAVAFTQNFDGVVAPALPAGWTSTLGPTNILGIPWVTSTTNPVSAPNDAFAPDPSNIGDMFLTTPSFAVPAGGATLSFKINYITESTFDGVVLEYSTDPGHTTWTDITSPSNPFITGPYTGPISTAFASPIAGRQAWNGTNPGSPAYVASSINMPSPTFGQGDVQLRWRMASDNSVAATGVRLDDVSISNPVCGGTAPTITSLVARLPINGGPMTIDENLPPGPSPFAVIPNQSAPGGCYQLIVTLAGPGPATLGGVSVLSKDGLATATIVSVSGNVITLNVCGVTNGQVLRISLLNLGDTLGGINIPVGILLGDSNGDGVVNSGDSTQTKSRSGQVTDATNIRSDINLSGTINSGDTSLVKAHAGDVLPGPLPPP